MSRIRKLIIMMMLTIGIVGATSQLCYALEDTGNSTWNNFINDSRFTDGVSWPGNKEPVLRSYRAEGCCAYCCDYVKYCYNINDPRNGAVFYDANEIRPGDVLTVGDPYDGNGHWFICFKRNGNSLYVAEGNGPNDRVRIGWNYTVSGVANDPKGFTAGYHFADPEPIMAPMDVNFYVNGRDTEKLTGIGNIQVYVDGQLQTTEGASSYVDFCQHVPVGKSYEVKVNITNSDYRLIGVDTSESGYTGQTGTTSSTMTKVRLVVCKMAPMDVNFTVDGNDTSKLTGIGNIQVYVDGQLQTTEGATSYVDFCQHVFVGKPYEVRVNVTNPEYKFIGVDISEAGYTGQSGITGENETFVRLAFCKMAPMDVNFTVNGEETSKLTDIGNIQVYVDGELQKTLDEASYVDFYQHVPIGKPYEVRVNVTNPDYKFFGVDTSQEGYTGQTGTTGENGTLVRLVFCSLATMDVNFTIDGEEVSKLTGIGNIQVYVGGELQKTLDATDYVDFCQHVLVGLHYEVKLNITNSNYKFVGVDTTESGYTGKTGTTGKNGTLVRLVIESKDSISQTVTFKVENGKWDDESTADKTVTLNGHEGDTLKLTAEQIPAVGTKPNNDYKAGSWNVTPSTDAAITEATTYTYTYAAKEASVVTKAPEAKTLTYNGSAQEIVTAGEATGGTMQYALGDANGATQPYTTSIPTATDAGTYYVWYKVVGDGNHNSTEPVCVTVTITPAIVWGEEVLQNINIKTGQRFTHDGVTLVSKEGVAEHKNNGAMFDGYNYKDDSFYFEFDRPIKEIRITGKSHSLIWDGARVEGNDIIWEGEPTRVVYFGKYIDQIERIEFILGDAMQYTQPIVDFVTPGALKTIAAETFYGIGAKNVRINDGVTFLGRKAFANCQNLKSIYIPDSVTDIANDLLSGCGNVTVYGKSGSEAEEYATNNGFAFIAIQ